MAAEYGISDAERGAPRLQYGIADAERLLGVKAHTIRYWEQEVPLLKPKKDVWGRRVYGNRELQLLFRLKYLLYERRFTIDGAREQLYRELAGDYDDIQAELSALRNGLLELYFAGEGTGKAPPVMSQVKI